MASPREERAGRVPVTLLTGFLGAGKTTLLNRILTERHGERIAVVVNEFGEVGIDGRLVVGATEEVVELVNGCICCTVRGDLCRALGDLLRRRRRRLFRGEPFARLLIETSGLASPGPVLQTLVLEPELAAETVAEGVICLAHAAHVAEQFVSIPEVEEQIGYADVVVLNHCDQADAPTIAGARRAITACNGLVPVQETTRAEIAVGALLAAAREGSARRGDPPSAAGVEHVADAHADGAGTVVLRTDQDVDLHKLKMWLQFLAAKRSHELWRLKGIFACPGHAKAVVVQGVYQFLELGPGEEDPPAESLLVLIGRHLDREEIHRGWDVVRGA